MASYFKDRKQIIQVNGVNGGHFFINIGVGQGTVLGPTLFKIYIMDLHLHTTLFCMKFADDSSFECSDTSRDALELKANTELAKISEWFKANRLTLHPDKSRFIIHSRDKLINLKLDDKPIMRCGSGRQEESVKLLGVHIDEDLNWKIHIKYINKKISKGNYLLWRHRKKLNIDTKKLIYESFVGSHLLYCLTVWGGAESVALAPLVKTLKKIWKKIGPFKQHTLNRLHNVQILKLEHELAIHESKFIWKWHNRKLPKSLYPILTEKENIFRSRRFVIIRNAKLNSLNYRLAKRASNMFNEIIAFTSKASLNTNMRKKVFETKYIYHCSTRNCWICQ
jgi:hypothetical protein